MKKPSEILPKGLGGKLIRLVVLYVLCLGLFFLIVTIANLNYLGKMVKLEGEKQTDLVQEKSMEAISGLTEESLYETVTWAADKTDDEFWILQHDLLKLREQVEDVLRYPEKYETLSVEPPKKENAGKYVLQLLCPGSYEEISPETMESMGKLANLSSMMEEMVRGNTGFTVDNYIATPDGVSIAMDNLSDGKYDENGVIRSYDATTRPWYQEALGKDEVVFIPAHSQFYDFNEVIYSVPVYIDGTLAAVLEGSSRVEVLEEKLAERNIGKSGFSILVSDDGQLVCSPRIDGELKMREDVTEDIRPSLNAGLAETINKGLAGEHGVTMTEVDGAYYYTAYDKLKTIGWTQLAFVAAEELQAPAQGLAEDMDTATQDMLTSLRTRFRNTMIFLILLLAGVAVLAIVTVNSLAKRRVAHIKHMTEKVHSLTEKDMIFEMEPVYETGDEIETLARSFEQQSKELKEYVEENIRISAEKERIGAELNVATKIQEDMLPNIFPVFPDRKEFEIYASMDPAKEVGGDFYDMFLIDEDHLCMVVGDVSGKGVPAALFMVISKTMLKNRAQAGGKPSEILFDVNNSLCEGNREKMFVTIWLGILTISTGELVEASAGHEYPAVCRMDGDYELFEDDHGFVLGGMEDMPYQDNELVLKKGDTLFIYTDGLPEATNGEGKRLEEKGMLEALNAHKAEAGEQLLSSISEEVNRFVGDAPQFDDLTMLVLRYYGC
ncbi:MAG: SpoIIE family protein phosphatase [Lachnospiraceae bacterium]|nr:SpoIIE family protein phosphatase [Lachnospiraceae bacterium]